MNKKTFYSADDSYHVDLHSTETLTANRIQKLPDENGTLVTDESTQTLTNKTLTSPVVTGPTIDGIAYDANNDRQVICEVVAVSGDTVHSAVTALKTLSEENLILRVILNITTPSTGASTIDIGYTATSATTGSDTFLDGISGTPAAVFDSMDASLDTSTNCHAQLGASGKWITMKEATGDTSGLVGQLYIFYVKTA